jgi:hypothetical protein
MAVDPTGPVARRAFLSRLGLGFGGAAAVGTTALAAQAPAAETARFQPARHAIDDWFDQVPGKHRFILDTASPEAFGNALAFLNNYFTVNKTAYNLQDSDIAVVLIARHLSTLYAYNDTVWGKYGEQITQRTNFNDPTTKQAPKINLFNSTAHANILTNRGTTLSTLLARGLRLAVCMQSSRGYAAGIAMTTGATPEAVYNELVANVMPNAHMVPAGITAINRAQERGYSIATVA